MSVPPTQRRWFRFSVRSLFVLMVIVAVPLAWKFNRVRTQRRVAREIELTGGRVLYDYECHFYVNNPIPRDSEESPDHGWVRFTLGGTREFDDVRRSVEPVMPPPPGPHWLRVLLGEDFFAEVTAIQLADDRSNDQSLDVVSDLPGLTALAAFGVTDHALERLKGRTAISALELDGFFTDAGVAKLDALTSLKVLSLSSPRLTDEGILSLRKLKSLRTLLIANDEVSQAAVAELHRALPECSMGFVSRDGKVRFRIDPEPTGTAE